MSERTPAQRAADHRKSFPAGVSAKRCALIDKEPNLTDYERAELSLCEQIIAEWEAPIWAEQFAYLDELEKRLGL